MKGRKKDAEFVSQFISQCVQEGRQTPAEILQAAKDQLDAIDRLVLGAEQAKKKRPQLLDVISSFEADQKDHSEDKSVLSFYRLKHPNSCQFWVGVVAKNGLISLEAIKYMSNSNKFVIKQMVEQDILRRDNSGELLPGSKFEEYLAFCEGNQ
jgi:hypothetical protein